MRTGIVSAAVSLFVVMGAGAQTERKPDVTGEKARPQKKADPEATKLLTEARQNRALWKDFPGFSADAEVNLDGKVSKGKVTIDARGAIRFEGLEKAAQGWARQVLALDVDHRLNAETGPTACYFTDDDRANPLGRAVTLLGDGMGSVYRVRDRQVVVVNRMMDRTRFAITVLHSTLNAEGKYLPGSFVVHYWDADSGDLRKTEAFTHAWKRVGDFDLPATTRVVSTSRQVSVKCLTLTNHALLSKHGR
jgi:hypothetical protein